MEYVVEIRHPKHERTTVTAEELPRIYADLEESASPTVVWNDDGDDVLIVAVGDDYSFISLKTEWTWYYLVVSDDEEEIAIELGEVDSYVPRKALAPREFGLAVLLSAGDLPTLRTDYMWEAQ